MKCCVAKMDKQDASQIRPGDDESATLRQMRVDAAESSGKKYVNARQPWGNEEEPK